MLDGTGDKWVSCLDGKTPLNVACTPSMDYPASTGINGLYRSLAQGIPISNETAHFVIFGDWIEDFS